MQSVAYQSLLSDTPLPECGWAPCFEACAGIRVPPASVCLRMTLTLLLTACLASRQDPAWTKAEELAESQLSRMHIFYNVDRVDFQRQLEASLVPKEKVLLCLDARTSKPKILTDGLIYLLETAIKVCGRDYVKCLIPTGSRLELLHILKARSRI